MTTSTPSPRGHAFVRWSAAVLATFTFAVVLASAAVGIAPTQAGAQDTTDPTIVKFIRCEDGGASIEVFVDNRNGPTRGVIIVLGWKRVQLYAIAGRIMDYDFTQIPDGLLPVSYNFGPNTEEREATVSLNCRAQQNRPNVQLSTGCASGTGYASFLLTNPTKQNIEFAIDSYGKKSAFQFERGRSLATVPPGQNRVVNFFNLTDSPEYRFAIATPDIPIGGFYAPQRPMNYDSTFPVTCGADEPGSRSEPYHVVSSACAGNDATLQLYAISDPKRITAKVDKYSSQPSYKPKASSLDTLISGMPSRVYKEVYVRTGKTEATYKNMIFDCSSAKIGNFVPNDPVFEGVPDKGSTRVEVVNKCQGGRGIVRVHFYNETPKDQTYSIIVSGLSRRTKTARAGEHIYIGVSGRPDGSYNVTALDGSEKVLLSENITVACEPPAVPARVTTSCLARNGKVDVHLNNLTSSKNTYDVSVGSIERSVTLSASQDGRVAVSGRRDGQYPVTVNEAGRQIFSETISIACD